MRACEACRGPGPSVWEDSIIPDKGGRYLCRGCHSDPNNVFFREAEARTRAYRPSKKGLPLRPRYPGWWLGRWNEEDPIEAHHVVVRNESLYVLRNRIPYALLGAYEWVCPAPVYDLSRDEDVPAPKSAPSQREALRGWSRAVASEYTSPSLLGAHEIATEYWGREVADWLWPLQECLAYERELDLDDEDLVQSRKRWEDHGAGQRMHWKASPATGDGT